MASTGYLESLLNTLPDAVKKPLQNFTREAFKTLRFGAPSSDAVAAENFGAHLVPFTTSSSADGEVAVAHRLARIPRLAFQMLPLDTVNATVPVLTVTRAADAMFLYVSSPTTSATGLLYVE
jgi:hypothetical protein